MIPGWGDLRLVPAALAVWSVALTAWNADVRAAVAMAAAWGVVGLAAAAAPRTRASIAPVLALAAVAASASGIVATQAVQARAWIPAHLGEVVEVEGAVSRSRALEVRRGEPRAAVRLEIARWSEPGGAWRRGRGTVVVVVDGAAESGLGAEMTVRGTLTSATGGTVDALLDASWARASPPRGWRAAVARARSDFEAVLDGVGTRTAPVVAGMVLGDTAGMPEELVAQLRGAGLAHLTAVSGAHFAILAAGLGAVLRRARASPVVVAGLTLAGCVAFAATVSGGGSVLRALVMAGVAAGALVAGRRGQPMPALAAAVIVLLLMRPELATDAGLALSVASVAAIAQLAPALSARLRRVVRAPLADVAALTLAAQAACLPILALIDAEVGPWAVAANAVATPFAVPVTLLGVAGLVLAGPAPAVAALLAHGAAWCAWPVVIAARAFTAAPGGEAGSATGVRGVLLGACVLAATVGAARLAGRRWRLAAAAAMLATVLLHAPPRWIPERWGGAIDGWTVVVCDVGQGDAILVRSDGATAMIDVGPPGDAAARCLERLGVDRIDLLVLSHEHADHTGGLREVREVAQIAHVWLPQAPANGTLEAVAGLSAAVPATGEAWEGGGVRVEVLQTGPTPRSRDGTEVNDSSTVVRIDAEGLTMIALGDLEVDGQLRLARVPRLAGADVVKVAHHGSAAQASVLAEALASPVALVSVGADNDHGHPAPETVALYGGGGATVLRTDLCGDIVLGARDGAPTLVRRCRSPVAP
ncbi:ComEC/Rec2 family competence protein [Demequina mangrovi]|uniref:Competence protein ComEC n=1 Tax=Demequina mangrovi TaxID=1043493 RepID=A0A1H6V7P8_9MICO|nr:ComEC/Rec2 family competence protein [Demequina mangrovi]SEI96352.1 competence protein ComEC [Demequina mangrovi]